MRTFIAIELDRGIRDYLAEVQLQLKSKYDGVKWVNPSNIHLTLKFLGNISQQHIKPLIETLVNMARDIPSFEFSLTQLGAFPNTNRPQVIWMGVLDKDNRLESLAASLEDQLSSLKLTEKQENFHPHITLGRVKLARNLKALSERIQTFPKSPPRIQQVGHLALFKSTLSSQGPLYEKINDAALSVK